ncbi:hypothetical protein OUZ56_021654 [Daphnia magna]|uniref:Reverse transcriptase RNase H-like domain-containing protein n=1 Tax=Daphnia magna TaxID=35525 RepID=A0ABR0AU77_9CRUS|nr:hypothetical protein OUZ56_021654 [Daphnia magna]
MEMGGGTKGHDASGYGIGAVFSQIQPPPQSVDSAESDGQNLRELDGVEVVIAYTSKHLNDRKAKWSTTEKETYFFSVKIWGKLALTPMGLFGSVRSTEGEGLWEELNRRLVENKIYYLISEGDR